MHLLLETNRSVSSYAEITSSCAICMAFQVLQVSSWLQYLCSALSMWILCCFQQDTCLWCTISCDQLKVPPSERDPTPKRTLSGLKSDYLHFMAAGGNIKKAKLFNNVIAAPLYEVELDQVN